MLTVGLTSFLKTAFFGGWVRDTGSGSSRTGGRAATVLGNLAPPLAGAGVLPGGGAGEAGGTPKGCPSAGGFARGFLNLVSSVSARAREGWPETLCWCGFRLVSGSGLLGHFPGLKGRSPGEWDIYRAQSTALKSYPQPSLFLGRYDFGRSEKNDWEYVESMSLLGHNLNLSQ